jgi:hypothetical protein
MKVVINTCYGGFGISEAGMLKYAELKEIKLYPEKSTFGNTYWTVENYPVQPASSASKEDRKAYNDAYCKHTLYENDIARDDLALVQMVEDLGSEVASGNYAELKVIEIPDGINWEIDEYDGNESISECHRSWC